MLVFVIRCSTLMIVGLLASGCGWVHWGGAQRSAAMELSLADARRAPPVLGRVALVNEGERFALIEANLAQPLAPGTRLRIFTGKVLSAELRATGVQRRPFLVADLVSGTPAKGDVVVQAASEAPPQRAVAATPMSTPSPPATPGWRRWLGFFRGRK